MPQLYEYKHETKNANYHVLDTFCISDCGQDIHIGMNSFVLTSSKNPDFENTTSIVLPLNEVKPLIEGVLKATDKNAPLLLAVDAHQLAVLYSALVMLIEQMQGEVIQEKIPYELASDLKTRLTDIVASNPTKFSEIGAIL